MGTDPWLDGWAGFGFRSRSAAVDLTTGNTRRLDVGAFPVLSAGATVRLPRSQDAWLRRLYARFELHHSIGLSSRTEAGQDVSTTAFALQAAAGYLQPVGAFELGGELGFAYDSFNLERNVYFTSTRYGALRIGARARGEWMDGRITVDIDLGVRPTFSTGDLTPRFGHSASAFGFDAQLSAGGALPMGVVYGARFGIIYHTISFRGPAEVPGDTATGGSDFSWQLMVLGGWRL